MKNGARARPSRKLHPASIAAARCCGRNTNCCECYAKKIGLVTPGGFEFVATAFTLNCLILPPSGIFQLCGHQKRDFGV
jgi:hypothetical protein